MINLPFVWELDNKGITSCLIGTMHLLPEWSNLFQLETIAHELLSGKKNLLLESHLEGNDLRAVYDEVKKHRVEDYWQGLTEDERVLLGNLAGKPPEQLATQPPILLMYDLFRAAGQKLIPGIEEILKSEAENHVPPISCSGLETREEMIRYNQEINQNLPDSLARILEMERREPGSVHRFTYLTFFNYFSGSEAAVLTNHFQKSLPSHSQRNDNMVQRSLSYLEEPSVVAVGLSHCIGEHSLVDLYPDHGITIRRI
ncbi:TraB/GumN family protein [Candidatus Woesearchaeota archaeon]|nr:TraB/GumN family protein [Candidatus Woesearchaeota archaeon]